MMEKDPKRQVPEGSLSFMDGVDVEKEEIFWQKYTSGLICKLFNERRTDKMT